MTKWSGLGDSTELSRMGLSQKLKQRAQTTKPKLEKPQRAPPAHIQAPPEPNQLPLDENMQNTT
jgi:hypothetical protein